ncbi:MAG TPA: hypothetical protein VF765_08560 [Polyangiaceae bacterium]
MRHPYRDQHPEAAASRDVGSRDVALATAIVLAVALLRCTLAVLRDEPPCGDPLLAMIVVIGLGRALVGIRRPS